MRGADATCKNKGAWVAKSLIMRDLVGGALSLDMHGGMRVTIETPKFHFRGQERPFGAQGALCYTLEKLPDRAGASSLAV